MSDLTVVQYILIALIFVWSGFVRSGLGFGGAVLSLPFLLLVLDEPLVFLPLISIHLLVFSSLTIWLNNRKVAKDRQAGGTGTVDWRYLGRLLAIMIVPKLIGVFGLITLPGYVMSSIIFVIVALYSLSYIANRPFRSGSKTVDTIFLMLGGLHQWHFTDWCSADYRGGGAAPTQGEAQGYLVCPVVYPGTNQAVGIYLGGCRPATHPSSVAAAGGSRGACDRALCARPHAPGRRFAVFPGAGCRAAGG